MSALEPPVERLLRFASLLFPALCMINGALLIGAVAVGTTQPTAPQAALGKVVPWDYRGTTHYLTEGAATFFGVTSDAMMPLFLAATLVAAIGWWRIYLKRFR